MPACPRAAQELFIGRREFSPLTTFEMPLNKHYLSSSREASSKPHSSSKGTSLLGHAQLVVAVLRNVAHPRKSLVAALFDDFEVPHLNARHCEVRDLKLYLMMLTKSIAMNVSAMKVRLGLEG